MSNHELFADDITAFEKPAVKKIDDFETLKGNTMDFLSHERAEKIDVEKPKVEADDFLNFHDVVHEKNLIGDVNVEAKQEENPIIVPTIEEKKTIEPENDFHAIEDDEDLNPYESSDLLKSSNEPQNEKFISSEDLLTDFKDPIPAPAEPEPEPEPEPKIEVFEAPKPIVFEQPPVSEPIKPAVVETAKPKTAPPPVETSTSDDTQIEAEKIFKSIGLG
jgi:hypothetical protein